MNSPLQGGSKRGAAWEGPSFAPRAPRGGRVARRALGVLLGALAGVAAWLTFAVDRVEEGGRLGVLGAVLPGDQSGPSEGRAAGGGERGPGPLDFEADDRLHVDLSNPPAAGLVVDLDSGEVLWERRPRAQRPVASLTKVMTALLLADELRRPERKVEIDRPATGTTGSGGPIGSAVGLEPGRKVELGALWRAMLIASANDAATALAIDAAGSERAFVRRMNERAGELGLRCTRFVSPHGFERGNRSCPADLAQLSRLAMEEPAIERVARKRRAVVDFPMPGGRRHLATTNPLLQDGYPGAVGLKTGFTQDAGRSLIGVARRDGRELAAILLDASDPAMQARRLLDAAFDQRPRERGAERETGSEDHRDRPRRDRSGAR
jgi:D-alanyl-D-alanine carboxypeptidase (penicillin-binding protein 5/6)